MQFLYDIAHQIHIMASSCPIVPDGACHPLVNGLMDNGYRKHSPFTFKNILVFQHNPIPVETVYNNIFIRFLIIITYNRHCVPIHFNALVKQTHFRRGHAIRIIVIRLDFMYRNRNYIINRAFMLLHLFPPIPYICFLSYQWPSAAACSAQTP